MSKTPKFEGICVGAIAGGFGVKGEVRLKSFCAKAEDIKNYSPLFDEAGNYYTITALRAVKDTLAARISEIPHREAAEALHSTRLYVERARFPELSDEEYYYSDLIGLNVEDTERNPIGKVKAVQNYGAGDILEIHYQSRTILIPFTQHAVPRVDIQEGLLIIDPPLGVLD